MHPEEGPQIGSAPQSSLDKRSSVAVSQGEQEGGSTCCSFGSPPCSWHGLAGLHASGPLGSMAAQTAAGTPPPSHLSPHSPAARTSETRSEARSPNKTDAIDKGWTPGKRILGPSRGAATDRTRGLDPGDNPPMTDMASMYMQDSWGGTKSA